MTALDIKPRVRVDAHGWIKWEGGECPVPNGTKGEVRFGNGTEADGWIGSLHWQRDIPSEVCIIAYRIIRDPRS